MPMRVSIVVVLRKRAMSGERAEDGEHEVRRTCASRAADADAGAGAPPPGRSGAPTASSLARRSDDGIVGGHVRR